MKHYFLGGCVGLFAWSVFMLFVPLVIPAEHSSTVWEFDAQRAWAARLDAQRRFSEEFARTNKDPTLAAVVDPGFGMWRPMKGQRELGYRNDGVVVWRFVPESK